MKHRNYITRICGIILAVIVSMAALSGCKPNASTPANSAELVNNTYTSGFPIVKEKITLSLMLYKTSLHGDFDEMSFTKYYEEKTNVHIDWQFCGWGADASQKKTLAFSSGNLPDMFMLSQGSFLDSDAITYGGQGQLVDLTNLVAKWAPDVNAFFEKYPETIKASTTPSGKIFTLPRIRMENSHVMFLTKLFINKKWLDNLGLDMPVTTDDFYNCLKSFKNDDPNGNGEADEIPFAYTFDRGFFGTWGLNFNDTTYNISMNQETGKLEYAYTTDAMRQGLTYLNKLYKENLLDQNLFLDSGSVPAAVKAGQVGAFYDWASFVTAGYDVGKDYELMQPLKDGDTAPIARYTSYDAVNPHMFMITSKCKNPEAALRWVDYFYTPAGHQLAQLGAPGIVYNITEDGKFQTIKEVDEKTRFSLAPCDSLDYGVDSTIDGLRIPIPDDQLGVIGKAQKQLLDQVKTQLMPFIPSKLLYKPFLSMASSELVTSNWAPSNDEAVFECQQFIVGDKNINIEWNQYVSDIKKLGIDAFIESYQKDYDNTYGK